MPAPPLTTPSLRLEPLNNTHRALYRALYTNPRVMARIGAPLDEHAADAAFARAVRAQQTSRPGHHTWAVHVRSTGASAGVGALVGRQHDTELGLMLLPMAWNARYSHEVIDALVVHAFNGLGIDVLTGICQAGPNERMSSRLLGPHGFQPAAPDRPGTARWSLERRCWTPPIGSVARSR